MGRRPRRAPCHWPRARKGAYGKKTKRRIGQTIQEVYRVSRNLRRVRQRAAGPRSPPQRRPPVLRRVHRETRQEARKRVLDRFARLLPARPPSRCPPQTILCWSVALLASDLGVPPPVFCCCLRSGWASCDLRMGRSAPAGADLSRLGGRAHFGLQRRSVGGRPPPGFLFLQARRGRRALASGRGVGSGGVGGAGGGGLG